MSNPFARSLSLRLLAIFAVTALLLVTLLVALFTQGLSSQWRRSIRPHLVQYVRYVQDDLGSPPDPERAEALAATLPVTIAIYRDGRFVHATDGRRPALDELRFRRLPSRAHAGSARDASPSRGARLSGAEPMRAAIARERRREGTVLRIERGRNTVYYHLEPPPGRRARGADGLYLALLAVTLVLLGSYLAIRRQLSPIRRIQRGVGRMSDGELEHRLALRGRDDLAELGRSIDEMAGRIGDMLDAKRQLLLAISHELRSPLARARVAVELLPESRQRERLEADLADMARLIDDLMESERLRTPHAALHRERLDLVRLVAEELAPHALAPRLVDERGRRDRRATGRPHGRRRRGRHGRSRHGRGPTRRCPSSPTRHGLRVLIRNLVGNALRHGRSTDGEARVTLTLSRRPETVRIEVADLGPGIPPEHLAAVTEPFHRPDAARTRASGGVGLGLSLARLVAEAHGGSLRVDSDPVKVPGTPGDGDAATRVTSVSPSFGETAGRDGRRVRREGTSRRRDGRILTAPPDRDVDMRASPTALDLRSPAFKDDPMPTWRRLHDGAAVVLTRQPLLGRVALATRHAEAMTVLQDGERFAVDARRAGQRSAAGLSWWVPGAFRPLAENMLTRDGEAHRALRMRVDRAFHRPRLERLQPRIDAITDEALATLAGASDADFVRHVARSVPQRVIGELLGLELAPGARAAAFERAVATLSSVHGPLDLFRVLPAIPPDRCGDPGRARHASPRAPRRSAERSGGARRRGPTADGRRAPVDGVPAVRPPATRRPPT